MPSITVTVSKTGTPPSYQFASSPSTIHIDPGNSEVQLLLEPGTGSPTVAFNSLPITWFDSEKSPIDRPAPFQAPILDSDLTVFMDSNVESSDHGTFFFRINVVADNVLIQSPDPTIINKDQ